MPQGRPRLKAARKANNKSRSGTPRATALQGTSRVQINDGNVSVAGRDNHIHTHMHYGMTINLESVLREIPNFRKIHQDTLAKATSGTGVWLLKGRTFSVWLAPNGDIKIMWGSGIPGAGKTIIAALVIDMLEALAREPGSRICVAYVYIRYSDRDQVTVRGILEVLVKQTYERNMDSRALIEAVYAQHVEEHTQPTEKELIDLLRELSERMSATFYVLDALDEAPTGVRLDIIKKLASLDVRLFITSRPLQALEAIFPDAHAFSIVAQDQDLDLHIAHKIDTSEALQDLLQECDPALKDEIVNTVKSKCGGMFLHASLQLDALQHCSTLHHVMQTLHAFPARIEDVYQQTWTRIVNSEPHHVSLAQTALLWVINAKQSMAIDQLRHALATSPETHSFEQPRLVPEATLMTICRGLITIDEESRLVRLVHYSAKRPLEELLAITFPHPHSHLSTVCLKHLTNCGLQDTATLGKGEALWVPLMADPLLHYAYHAWSFHAAQSFDDESARKRVTGFVRNCRAFPVDDYVLGPPAFNRLATLHMIIYYDLPMTAMCPGYGDELNLPSSQCHHTPLSFACSLGKVDAARALLNLPGILVNAKNGHGHTALMEAALRGRESAVALLLADSRINVNRVDDFGSSALHRAALNGHTGTLKLLLERTDLEVNLVDNRNQSALLVAAFWKYTSIVSLLLAHSEIEVNLVDKAGLSALMIAASDCLSSAVAALLLTHLDIEINATDREGCSALMMAASYGSIPVAQLLVSHPGTDINLVDNEGFSALLLAASYGRLSIVKLLLAHPNIRVNPSSPNSTTPLLEASYYGNTEVVKHLLAAPGINVNASDADGDTAVKMAAEQGNSEVVQMLVHVPGIDITHVGKDGHTAMSAAIANAEILIVFLLRQFEFINTLQMPWLLKRLKDQVKTATAYESDDEGQIVNQGDWYSKNSLLFPHP